MLSGEMRVGESLKLLPPPLTRDTSCSVSEPVSAVVYGSPGFGRPFSQDLPSILGRSWAYRKWNKGLHFSRLPLAVMFPQAVLFSIPVCEVE